MSAPSAPRFGLALVFAGVTALAAIACGRGQIGDDCGKENDVNQCVDEALCAKDKGGALFCLERCVQQADCPAGTTCSGTAGSNHVCQPN